MGLIRNAFSCRSWRRLPTQRIDSASELDSSYKFWAMSSRRPGPARSLRGVACKDCGEDEVSVCAGRRGGWRLREWYWGDAVWIGREGYRHRHRYTEATRESWWVQGESRPAQGHGPVESRGEPPLGRRDNPPPRRACSCSSTSTASLSSETDRLANSPDYARQRIATVAPGLELARLGVGAQSRSQSSAL